MTLARKKLYRFLDTNGDGTGTKNANVNGSVTPVVFKIQPPAGEAFNLCRMITHIGDAGALSADEYGNIAGLSNGVLVQVLNKADDALILDLCDGIPITTNSEWSRMSYDALTDSYGSGENFVKARWSFNKSGGPITLTEDEYFAVTIQDDLTGLSDHFFMAQGEKKR